MIDRECERHGCTVRYQTFRTGMLEAFIRNGSIVFLSEITGVSVKKDGRIRDFGDDFHKALKFAFDE